MPKQADALSSSCMGWFAGCAVFHVLWGAASGWWGLVEMLVFSPSSSWPGHLQSVLDAVAVRQTLHGQLRGQVAGTECVCWLL